MIDIVLALVTARLSLLFAQEDGPADIFLRLRTLLGVRYDENNQPTNCNFLASLFSCVWCLSLWFGVGLALLAERPAFYGCAYSMIAIMVANYVDGN